MQSANDLFSRYKFKSKKDYTEHERAKLVLEAEKLFFEKEKIAHSRWWQEDALVNNRLTWLLQSQVILFTAYGFLARGNTGNDTPPELKALVAALPWLGLSVCIVIALGVQAAWGAQRFLGDYYAQLGISVGVHHKTTTGGRIPGYFMPSIFAGGWGWLFKGYGGLLLFLGLSWLILLCIERWLTNLSKEPAASQAARP